MVTSTMTEADGFYALVGLPEGTFTLFAEKEGYEMLEVEGVDVVAGNETIVDGELIPTE